MRRAPLQQGQIRGAATVRALRASRRSRYWSDFFGTNVADHDAADLRKLRHVSTQHGRRGPPSRTRCDRAHRPARTWGKPISRVVLPSLAAPTCRAVACHVVSVAKRFSWSDIVRHVCCVATRSARCSLRGTEITDHLRNGIRCDVPLVVGTERSGIEALVHKRWIWRRERGTAAASSCASTS